MDIVIDNLTVGYGRRRVVATGLTTTVRGGELTCLLGRNGTGKSTLLRTLAGLLPVLAGRVTLGDRDLAVLTKEELARMVSIVLTERLAVEHLKVEELVGLGRLPYTGFWGTLREEDRQTVADCLRLTGTLPLSKRSVRTLSDGEQQKVMVAKALAQQTPIILLDEATAFLDHPSKQELFRLMGQLAHEQGKTVLMATHDVELAQRFADRLWEFQ